MHCIKHFLRMNFIDSRRGIVSGYITDMQKMTLVSQKLHESRPQRAHFSIFKNRDILQRVGISSKRRIH